jgi:hypothetical protein
MKKILLLNSCNKALAISIVIILSLVLIVPVFSGCSGTATSNTFIELLNLVPVDAASGDGPIYFTLADHTSFYKDTGITFSTPEELIYIMNTEFSTLWHVVYGEYITGYGSDMDRSTIRKEYVGYDITCIDAEIQFGNPPYNGVAAIGRFNPGATEDALNNRDEWPSWAVTAYTTKDYRGVTIHSWGDGLKTNLQYRLMPPHIDMLGRARPLAITDKYLFYAASVETVKLLVDASENAHSSVADLPEYAAIANGLADLKAYAAMIVHQSALANTPIGPGDAWDSLTEAQKQALADQYGPRLKKYVTFGSGVGMDEKGTYTAIVIYHENSADALANVSLLKQRIENSSSGSTGRPWSERITDSDIRAEGNVLLAKLYSSAGLWASWVYAQDNLLYHEE